MKNKINVKQELFFIQTSLVAAQELPIPAVEFLFDTTRTVINLIFKGTIRRFQNIKFVIPHAEAFLSIFSDRLAGFIKSDSIQNGEDKIDVYADHLFYGSDYPYTPEFGCVFLADFLNKTELITDEQRRDIYYNNALKLFPRLAENDKL